MMGNETIRKVKVTDVGKCASGLVFLIMMFNLVIWVLTGLYSVYPPMAGLVSALAAYFYFMSWWIERRAKHKEAGADE